MSKKVVYIAGPITGVPNYETEFAKAEAWLRTHDFTPLNPARLPQGMTNEQYTRIDFAMIDAADAVYFMPEWFTSPGATLEMDYCKYNDKQIALDYNTLQKWRKEVETHE
jgi:nucleoside 2-deoxyribosyltransferase